MICHSSVIYTLLLPVPRIVKVGRSVVGTFSWYRRFDPTFSTLISPRIFPLKKSRKFVQTIKYEKSFEKIKDCLVNAPVLHCTDYNLPFVFQFSGYNLGAVVIQTHPDGDRVISYLGRALTKQSTIFHQKTRLPGRSVVHREPQTLFRERSFHCKHGSLIPAVTSEY